MVVLGVLHEARAAGLEVHRVGGDIRVRGPRRLEAIVQTLVDRKPEILAALEAEEAGVAWRMEAMRLQVPMTGPIPILIARSTSPRPGCCLSCGDIVESGRIRCHLCSEAARAVLLEVREGVP